MTYLQPKTVVTISLLIGALVSTVSLVGIYSHNFYSRETSNWQIQSVTQDLVDLVLIVPALIAMSLLTFSTRRVATLLWAGILFYVLYTFVIYCFSVHFNSLFLAYCLVLGLSGYSFFYFLFATIRIPYITTPLTGPVLKITGYYFIVVSLLFFALWSSEIVPFALKNSTPLSLIEVGLPTNPVHVLDLAFVLPGIFLIGVTILRKNPVGITLAPVVLAFFILMDITIASISVTMIRQGLDENFTLAIVMGTLAVATLALLTWFLQFTRADELR